MRDILPLHLRTTNHCRDDLTVLRCTFVALLQCGATVPIASPSSLTRSSIVCSTQEWSDRVRTFTQFFLSLSLSIRASDSHFSSLVRDYRRLRSPKPLEDLSPHEATSSWRLASSLFTLPIGLHEVPSDSTWVRSLSRRRQPLCAAILTALRRRRHHLCTNTGRWSLHQP